MKEVPKKELPGVAGGAVAPENPFPNPTPDYPQTPGVPGPTDQEDPFKYLY